MSRTPGLTKKIRKRIARFKEGCLSTLGIPLERRIEVRGSRSRFRGDAEQIRYLAYLRSAEGHVLESIIEDARPDDVFYDVGAGYGLYSCLVPAGQTIVFEPDPDRIPALRENIDRNEGEADLLELVLGDEDAEGVRTATSLVREGRIPPPTLVKVDVEGAEAHVIRGMEELLKESVRRAYVEIHPEGLEGEREHGKISSSEVQDLIRRLEGAGLRSERVEPEGSPPFLIAVREEDP